MIESPGSFFKLKSGQHVFKILFYFIIHQISDAPLVGVLNLTNRAQRGVYTEDDVERVRLLGLVISLLATRHSLGERLIGAMGDR